MEDPKLIATLIPIEKQAELAFRLPHNADRHLSPAGWSQDGSTISSREQTPGPDPLNGEAVGPDYNCSLTHCIRLDFDEGPRDPTRGFSFGTSKDCDVQLGHRGVAIGISRTHFCVTLDENKRVLLKDSSTHGTSVSYDGQAEYEVRQNFTWILNLTKENGQPFDVEVHLPGKLAFKVVSARHGTCEAEFGENLARFLESSRAAFPPLDQLGFYSYPTTVQPSQPLTPRRHPIYIRERWLDKGSFGEVDMVINVSTGSRYARKTFVEPQWRGNQRRMQQEEQDWLEGIRREIRIMRDHRHERTVPVVDFREEPSPFLVMPFFPLGNLEDMHRERPIAVEETIDILFQALDALAYLHPRGVVHRDLKPGNILVDSRDPLSIKLADFGLAKDGSDPKTLCGTRLYMAPEVYSEPRYTSAVDLWSLGVIILEYAYGLPKPREIGNGRNEASITKQWGRSWCVHVVKYANDWDSEGLIDLLTAGMLRILPDERLPADVCLETGYRFGLFHDGNLLPGSTTPTQRLAPECATKGGEGIATAVSSNLWNCEVRGEASFTPDANQPTGSGSYKRQQSPTIRPDNPSSSGGRAKRHRQDVANITQTGSRTYILPDQNLDHDGGAFRFRSMHHAVLALLTDLRVGNKSNSDKNVCSTTVVEEICVRLARLNIGQIHYHEQPNGVHITATSRCREISLASLTTSERKNSAAELAARLLHMLQLLGTKTGLADELPVQTGPIAQGAYTQDRPGDRSDSWAGKANAGPNDLTVPEALPRHLLSARQYIRQGNGPDAQRTLLPQDIAPALKRQDCRRQRPDVEKCYTHNGAVYWPWVVRGEAVYVCESPRSINATQLLRAAGLSRQSLPTVLQECGITRTWTVRDHPNLQGTYIDCYCDGATMCQHLGLENPPASPRGGGVGIDDRGTSSGIAHPGSWEQMYSTFHPAEFYLLRLIVVHRAYQPVLVNGRPVHFCPEHGLINATQFCAAHEIPRISLSKVLKDTNTQFARFHGQPDLQGTYVIYRDMKKLCAFLDLREESVDTALSQLFAIQNQKALDAHCQQRTTASLADVTIVRRTKGHTVEEQQIPDIRRSGPVAAPGLDGGFGVVNDQQHSTRNVNATQEHVETLSDFCSDSFPRGVTYPSDLSLSYFF